MHHPYHMMRALAKHRSKKENYRFGNSDPSSDLIMGLTPLVFTILFIFVLLLWVYSLYLLVKYWNQLPTWLQVVGIICLLVPYGSIVSIVLITMTVKR